MERFLIGFFGTLLLFGIAAIVSAIVAVPAVAAIHFLGPLIGIAIVLLAVAIFVGAMHVADGKKRA